MAWRKAILAAGLVAIVVIGDLLLSPPSTPHMGLDTQGCLRDNSCKFGNRVEDAGLSKDRWAPFKSADPFVWAADACLGYFMTRSAAALNGGITEFRDEDHWYVAWGARAKIHLLNWPFHEYGTFNCESRGWTLIPQDSNQKAELEKWVEARLMVEDGWTGKFDPTTPSWIVNFRNDDLGVEIRVSESDGGYSFLLEADYFGPPIILTPAGSFGG